jgi:hypothetical protein
MRRQWRKPPHKDPLFSPSLQKINGVALQDLKVKKGDHLPI